MSEQDGGGPDNKDLTLRQKRYAINITEPDTKTQTRAAIDAGYSPRSATQIASENMTKPKVKTASPFEIAQQMFQESGCAKVVDRSHAENRVEIALCKRKRLCDVEIERNDPVSIAPVGELLGQHSGGNTQVDGDDFDTVVSG